jgi:hypothetical protein
MDSKNETDALRDRLLDVLVDAEIDDAVAALSEALIDFIAGRTDDREFMARTIHSAWLALVNSADVASRFERRMG